MTHHFHPQRRSPTYFVATYFALARLLAGMGAYLHPNIPDHHAGLVRNNSPAVGYGEKGLRFAW